MCDVIIMNGIRSMLYSDLPFLDQIVRVRIGSFWAVQFARDSDNDVDDNINGSSNDIVAWRSINDEKLKTTIILRYSTSVREVTLIDVVMRKYGNMYTDEIILVCSDAGLC